MNRRGQSIVMMLAAAATIVAGACVDMSAPSGTPASISVVQAPALFVVQGQQMLDSTGAPAPLSLILYDTHGNPVTGFTPSFFVTDTLRRATIGPDDIMTGVDTGSVTVIGQVGDVQTPPLTIYVTEPPDTVVSTLDSAAVDTTLLGVDTTVARGTLDLPVRVLAADGTTGIGGMLVSYSLAYTPDTVSRGRSSAVYLAGDDGKRSSIDTANATGVASRQLVVLTPLLADSTLRAGQRADSVVVVARVQYKGVPLPGAPIRFVIPLVVALSK